MTASPFESLTALCKGPHGEWKGKALSGADYKSLRSSQSSAPTKSQTTLLSGLFFVFAEGFVQLVAPRQTSLRVVSVVHRFAITM